MTGTQLVTDLERATQGAGGYPMRIVGGYLFEDADQLRTILDEPFRATWSTSFINNLPDAAFAFIEPGGEKDDDGKTKPRSKRHFPHHNGDVKKATENDTVDEPHLRNALARIPQSDLSDEAKTTAEDHCRAHAKALGIGDEEVEALVSGSGANSRATTVSDMLTLAKKSAFDPVLMEDRPPFFWDAQISNNTVDAYFTRMAKSSLQNYANEAAQGVSFQNSHNTRELPLGRSISGSFIGAQRNGQSRVEASFYTIPALRLGAVDTDQFINGVRAGIIRDVSIGFYGGEFRCNLCGRDMLRDWDCWHIPGFQYIKKDEGRETAWVSLRDGDNADDAQTAVADVENAHLAEVSAVYDGATPGAGILKAYQQAQAGRLTPDQARVLEVRYRINIPGAQHVWALDRTKQSQEERSTMGNEQPNKDKEKDTPQGGDQPKLRTLTISDTHWGRLTAALAAAGIACVRDGTSTPLDLEQLAAGVETLHTERSNAVAKVKELEPIAADGTEYRKVLVDEALAEGVRAHGNEFAKDKYEDTLRTAPLSFVRQLRDDWRKAAEKSLPAGRATTEGGDENTQDGKKKEGDGTRTVRVPDNLYNDRRA